MFLSLLYFLLLEWLLASPVSLLAWLVCLVVFLFFSFGRSFHIRFWFFLIVSLSFLWKGEDDALFFHIVAFFAAMLFGLGLYHWDRYRKNRLVQTLVMIGSVFGGMLFFFYWKAAEDPLFLFFIGAIFICLFWITYFGLAEFQRGASWRAIYLSLVGSLLAMELSWVIAFFPFNYYTQASIVALWYSIFWIALDPLSNRNSLFKNAIISFFLILLLLWSARWI
ncbi:MAG: hypothetical protein G01um101418_384 [Parcubacteria group bacterium Gr01-1014_18]|nr:MAG: hypothetical protein Greene041636_370 [Parcubacteria group bacterium Greene0416_36]TSC81105.1 MAG: hypothetical protein G01um101418_384 [Parcubacteria group bacterium Gr01-1014_18]TSC98479.1 MAG: hypothetical protein Greene101420_716 [Parcubacteria group bacterium Greene1014_20]TSD07356.1 MAG: hypothetical protein Greene07142_211 [Parcubacteria group bacterium Greene0714_2]